MAFNAADYTDPQGKAIPWYSQTANAASPDAAKARAAAGVTSAAPIQSQTEAIKAAAKAGSTPSTKPLTFGEKQAAKQAAANANPVNAGFDAANYTDPQGKAIPWYSQTANAASPDAAKARTVAGVTNAAPVKSQTEAAAAKATGLGAVATTGTGTTTGTSTTTVDGGISTMPAANELTVGPTPAAVANTTVNQPAAASSITSDVMNLYNTILDRDPTATGDQAGLDYWTKKFGDTLEASEVTEFAAAAAPELKAKGAATTTDGGGGFIGGSTWTDSAEYKSMQSQLTALQTAYDKLAAGQGGGGDSGIVTTGGLIDTGDGGASGVVYGPDGTMYSSAAAAIAAGVTNYTTTKPSIPGANTATAGDTQGFVIPSGQTGNTNPGGFISGAREQMFTMPTTAQLPGGIANPFIG